MQRTSFKRKVYERPPRSPVTPIVGCRGVYAAASNEPVTAQKEIILRSEPYRRYVASQECFGCRVLGFSQCAHENLGKGMALKVCDSRTWPACAPHWGLVGCHQQFDIGIGFEGMSRDQRRAVGATYVAEMQARATAAGWRFTDTAILAPGAA